MPLIHQPGTIKLSVSLRSFTERRKAVVLHVTRIQAADSIEALLCAWLGVGVLHVAGAHVFLLQVSNGQLWHIRITPCVQGPQHLQQGFTEQHVGQALPLHLHHVIVEQLPLLGSLVAAAAFCGRTAGQI